jgi:hypothetical protein
MKKEHSDVFFGMLCLCQNFEISQKIIAGGRMKHQVAFGGP